MSPWAVFAGVLLVAGLVPAVVVGARGRAVIRLAGLQFGGAVAVPVLLALCAAPDTTSYLVVPLALVLLSYAGTLVFTRLLAER